MHRKAESALQKSVAVADLHESQSFDAAVAAMVVVVVGGGQMGVVMNCFTRASSSIPMSSSFFSLL